jgi:hypothetical protein
MRIREKIKVDQTAPSMRFLGFMLIDGVKIRFGYAGIFKQNIDDIYSVVPPVCVNSELL